MNNRWLILIIVIFVSLLPVPLSAQRMTTMGTDFWVCFLNNNNDLYTGTKHKIFVSCINNCSVTVSNPRTGWSTTQYITHGEVATFEIPMGQCENLESEVVVNKGIHVTSTGTISVYSSTICTSTYDVANILPTPSLRDDYMLLSYPTDKWGCVFAIVATEDSTTVDIVLTNPTFNGASAGDTLTVFLQWAGQVYQVFQEMFPVFPAGETMRDITGTRVKSRDCKPIAVFNGDVCLYVPYFEPGQTCDISYEQSIPTAYWGRKFVVPRLQSNFDYVRVTALNDSTLVWRNSDAPVLLNAGETYDFQIGFVVGDAISSSLPVSVNVYFASMGIHGNGDPSMLNITPIEQMIRNVTFTSYSTPSTSNHRVNVMLRTADIGLFTLDGTPYPNSFLPIQSDMTYSSAIFTVSQGSHTLNMGGEGNGFVAHAFGLGQRESYAYSVGSNLNDLGNSLYVNGQYVPRGDNVTGCVGDTFTFVVKHEEALNYVVWDMGGSFLVGDSINYIFPTVGTNQINAYLSHSMTSCFGVDDTLSVNVTIFGSDTARKDTAVCHLPFTWFGNDYMEEDTIRHVLDNVKGCDSVLLMNLVIEDIDTVVLSFDGCDSTYCLGELFFRDTVLIRMLQTPSGCDSVEVDNVYIHSSYYGLVHETINQYDTLLWVDGNLYWSEDQHPEMTYRSIHGCDSTVRLSLTVIPYIPPPEPDSSSLWIPNCFTPDEETNSVFKVVSSEMEELHVTIFTRWGLYVSDFDGLTGSWDGTYKGEKCKQETYVYLIEYRTKTMPSVVQERVGTIMLLR